MLKRLSLIVTAVILSVSLVACGSDKNAPKDDTNQSQNENNDKTASGEEKPEPLPVPDTLIQLEKPAKGEEIAVLHTSEGDIKIRLFPDIAPKTVENFKGLINKGYYNGVIFHRVIKDFMIQGGDPEGTGMGGQSIWGEPFDNEINPAIRHFKGAVSMANTGQPKSNGSQFFIVENSKVDNSVIDQMKKVEESYPGNFPKIVVDKYAEVGGTPHLDGKHSVFGQVFEGLDIVDKIANTEVGDKDKPVKDITIDKAELVKYEE